MNEERELPLLPLRGILVFPYMVIHLDVGRERSMAAIEEAMLGGALQSPTPMRSATPIATAAVADAPGGPFSFDRFFPDPATAGSPLHTPSHSPSNTPAIAPARDVAPPTVSDDLAQFSAWLKGLGNS